MRGPHSPASDLQGAAAGGLEPVGAVSLAQAQDAEAGTKALLGMRLLLEDGLDQAGGLGPDRVGLMLQALVGPAGIAAMRARHVRRHGGVPPRLPGTEMARNPAAAVEQLDGGRGDPRGQRLADQAVRDRVVMPVDLDMVVDADPALLPLGVLVGCRWQRL